MPRQLPQSLGAVDIAQASPIIALKTDNRKEGKGGEGKKETARDTVSVLSSRAAKSLAALPRLPQSTKARARARHQYHCPPSTAGCRQLRALGRMSLSQRHGILPWLCTRLSGTVAGQGASAASLSASMQRDIGLGSGIFKQGRLTETLQQFFPMTCDLSLRDPDSELGARGPVCNF